MKKRIKNPAAVALGRAGGSVKSEAKRLACRANALKRWTACPKCGKKGGMDWDGKFCRLCGCYLPD